VGSNPAYDIHVYLYLSMLCYRPCVGLIPHPRSPTNLRNDS
jgi:hypothetical protein